MTKSRYRKVPSVILLFLLALGQLATLAQSQSPLADSPEVLPDGRTVIQIFRERVAFDIRDAGNVEFRRARDDIPILDLPTAIRSPEIATAYFNGPRSDYSDLYLRLSTNQENAIDPSRNFLGRFDWNSFPWSHPTYKPRFGIRPENNLLERIDKNKNRYWAPAHERLPLPTEREFARVPGQTASGFAKWESMAPKRKTAVEQDVVVYVLPGEERLTPAEHPLVIRCAFHIAQVKCTTKIMSDDGRVLFAPEWYEKDFPESNWKQLDESYRQLASHIFIDRNMGDFQ